MMKPNDAQWEAIKNNNQKQDHLFWYGVKTTGIFCRPSCPSRIPKRENVVIFKSTDDALKAGFRPCKRCRPTKQFVSNQVWVKEINHVLETHYQEKLTLDRLASLVHGSPSYLRHVYKNLTGMTPQQKLSSIRLSAGKKALRESQRPVAKIALASGMNSSAYFIHQFKNKYGLTPRQYRQEASVINK